MRRRVVINNILDASITLASWALIYLMLNSQLRLAFGLIWDLLGERSAMPSMGFYMAYRIPMVLFGTSLITASFETRGWVMTAVADGLAVLHEAAQSITGFREVSLLWTDPSLALNLPLLILASVSGCLLGTRLRKWFKKRMGNRPSEGSNVGKRRKNQ